VDPEIKKRIDDRIAQARQALELLDEESAQLTTEEAAIKADEDKYQKALVNIIHASFMDFLMNTGHRALLELARRRLQTRQLNIARGPASLVNPSSCLLRHRLMGFSSVRGQAEQSAKCSLR
jgi:hypothetical protein